MKTTVELPDALFQTIKETAARRKTTLKELFIHALKREVESEKGSFSSRPFDVDELGLPILHNQTKTVSIDLINSLREDEAPTQ